MTHLIRRRNRVGFLCGVLSVVCLPKLTVAEPFKAPVRTGIATGLNVDWAPTFSSDMLEVYFTSWRSYANQDIWSARREDVDLPWEGFQPLDIVTSPLVEDSPNLSPDGLTLTFESSGLEGGYGALDLWQTTRLSRDDPWLEPVNLGDVINSRSSESSPTFSPDRLEMIFASSSVLRRSTRPTLVDPWSEPETMSRGGEHEVGVGEYPSLSPDGLSLYFNRFGEFGKEDIFVSRRPALDAPFGPAENLGSTINTAGRDMMPRIASDGSLYYVRNAVTGQSPWAIWRAEAEIPWRPITLEAGDADQDLDFDQYDLVRVAQSGKYLNGQSATWGEGDWDGAPGGVPGRPPSGNGLFDQLDIVVALASGKYLQGPYAALRWAGQADKDQTSIGYDDSAGELRGDATTGTELTSVDMDSVFSFAATAHDLEEGLYNDSGSNIVKATFGSSFGSMNFGDVAHLALAAEFLLNNLTVVGSLDGRGDLGNVDLIYVPEPSTLGLAVVGLLGLVAGMLNRANKYTERR